MSLLHVRVLNDSGNSSFSALNNSFSFSTKSSRNDKKSKMAMKQSASELRAEILDQDRHKEVNVNCAVTIATCSGISAAAAVLAVLSLVFLESFRADIAMLWLACIPFCFPVITGVSIAYRKQLATVGVHIALLLTTGGAGGAGYGLSIEPVYLDRRNCTTPHDQVASCEREVLVLLYVIAGGVAAGFAVLGLLLSLCACSSATKRKAKRALERERRMLQEEERKSREVKQLARKSHMSPLASPTASLPPPLPFSSPPAAPVLASPARPTVTSTPTAAPNYPVAAPHTQSAPNGVSKVYQAGPVATPAPEVPPAAPLTPSQPAAATTSPPQPTPLPPSPPASPEYPATIIAPIQAFEPATLNNNVPPSTPVAEPPSPQTPSAAPVKAPISPVMSTTAVQTTSFTATGTQTEARMLNGHAHDHAMTHL